MNDDYIRNREGRIVGRVDRNWIRDGQGRLIARYDEAEDVTRRADGRIVGRGGQRLRELGDQNNQR